MLLLFEEDPLPEDDPDALLDPDPLYDPDALLDPDPLYDRESLVDPDPLIDEPSGVMSLLEEDADLDDVAAIVIGRTPDVGVDVTFIDAGRTTVGVVAVEGAAWVPVGWAAVEVIALTPPPPPTRELSIGPFAGRAEGTFAEAMVIVLA